MPTFCTGLIANSEYLCLMLLMLHLSPAVILNIILSVSICLCCTISVSDEGHFVPRETGRWDSPGFCFLLLTNAWLCEEGLSAGENSLAWLQWYNHTNFNYTSLVIVTPPLDIFSMGLRYLFLLVQFSK